VKGDILKRGRSSFQCGGPVSEDIQIYAGNKKNAEKNGFFLRQLGHFVSLERHCELKRGEEDTPKTLKELLWGGWGRKYVRFYSMFPQEKGRSRRKRKYPLEIDISVKRTKNEQGASRNGVFVLKKKKYLGLKGETSVDLAFAGEVS